MRCLFYAQKTPDNGKNGKNNIDIFSRENITFLFQS